VEIQAISDALGGRSVLGKGINHPADLAALVRQGLPARSIACLAGRLEVANSSLAKTLGIPQRTLTRRLNEHARLTAAESDRTVRLARVYAHAVDMIGDPQKAVGWLQTPNQALGGAIPMDLLDTDPGTRDVEDTLGRIAYGIYS